MVKQLKRAKIISPTISVAISNKMSSSYFSLTILLLTLFSEKSPRKFPRGSSLS